MPTLEWIGKEKASNHQLIYAFILPKHMQIIKELR